MIEKLYPGKIIIDQDPITLHPFKHNISDWDVGETIFLRGKTFRITHIEPGTLTVTVESFPNERQKTLGRLLGRSPDEFIP